MKSRVFLLLAALMFGIFALSVHGYPQNEKQHNKKTVVKKYPYQMKYYYANMYKGATANMYKGGTTTMDKGAATKTMYHKGKSVKGAKSMMSKGHYHYKKTLNGMNIFYLKMWKNKGKGDGVWTKGKGTWKMKTTKGCYPASGYGCYKGVPAPTPFPDTHTTSPGLAFPTIVPSASVMEQPTHSPTVSVVVSSPTTSPTRMQSQLTVNVIGPGAAFPNQDISLTVRVTNVGNVVANSPQVRIPLPSQGSFVSSNPAGVIVDGALVITLDDLPMNGSEAITLVWRTPDEQATLEFPVSVQANNAPIVNELERIQVGITTVTTGAVTSAGVGLRSRSMGTIPIADIADSATVVRAVLVWAILYDTVDGIPSNQITMNGNIVTANLAATISTNLCWGDDATIGYAADVTHLVTGNGDYTLTEIVNGASAGLPFTDGASLFVFYDGPDLDNQIVSDFTYSAINDIITSAERTFENVMGTGGQAMMHVAGPDGQNGSAPFRVTGGAGTLDFPTLFDGDAPVSEGATTGPTLWDHEILDVSSVIAEGTQTVQATVNVGSDCVGLSAVVLQVDQ